MRKAFRKGISFAMGMTLCMQVLNGCGQVDDSLGEVQSLSGTAVNSSEEEALYRMEENAEDSGTTRVSVTEGREPYDLLTQPWQVPQKAEPAPAWWNSTVYQEDLLQNPPNMTCSVKYRAVRGKDYYVLARYDNYLKEQEKWEFIYFLNRIDGDTLETECHQLYLEELGLKNPCNVMSIDVADGRAIVFIQEQNEESGKIAAYHAVWFDGEGHVEASQDLLPALRQAGLIQEGGDLWGNTAKWDSEGYYCVRGNDRSEQYGIIDATGNLVMVLDPARGLEEPNVNLYHDSQGRCIWEAISYKDLANVFWCVEEEQQVKLYEGDYEVSDGRVMNMYGDIYYVNSKNALVRWEVSTGKCENLYLGGGEAFREYCAFLQNSSGSIVLFYDDGDREYLIQIANEDVEKVVLSLTCYENMPDYYMNMFIGEFNRTHPGIQVKMKVSDSWEQRDANWARVQADLVAGQGPDLLMAPPEQIRTLQEKGLLTELSQVLEQDTLALLFPGVLEYGQMDGGLYSVSHTATATTLMISKELWPKDTWTWEEAVTLLEQLEQSGQPVQSIMNDSPGNVLTGGYLLGYFFLRDLEHCSLLDAENGKAYFDSEAFCHLLEVCKRYAQSENSTGDSVMLNEAYVAGRKRLKEGEILCYKPLQSAGEFRWFSDDLADFGEDYHLVGYPTEGQCGSFLSCNDGIAVNASSEHAKIAAEFVNYIVSRGCQENNDTPVRRDIFEGRISEAGDYKGADGKPHVFLRTSQGYLEIEARPDGTSYLPEYLAFMDSCRVSKGVTDPLREIILEEAEAYFSGDKDVQAVADIIQNRVQLYLNENW